MAETHLPPGGLHVGTPWASHEVGGGLICWGQPPSGGTSVLVTSHAPGRDGEGAFGPVQKSSRSVHGERFRTEERRMLARRQASSC